MIVMPLVFFAAMPIWAKSNVFDIPVVREWVTRRYGNTTYKEYLSSIRSMLLIAVANLVLGLVGIVNALRLSAPLGAYALSAFFLSSAAGIAICRAILAKQGVLYER